MSTVEELADASGFSIVARSDLAEAAVFQLSFAIGCVIAGAAVIAAFQLPGIGWHAEREAGEVRPVVTRAAFEVWAGRLLDARSGVRA